MKRKPYYETELGKLYHGNCLEIMPQLEPVDLVICDLPYGTTACKWDTVIPFKPLWKQYKRLINDDGAILLMAMQPFTSALVMSNIGWFKYEWIWIKNSGADVLMAKNKPLNRTESVLVFSNATFGTDSKNRMKYNPQGVIRINKNISGKNISGKNFCPGRTFKKVSFVQTHTNYPNNILKFKKDGKLHPSQKPADLFEYLIKTYANDDDTIIDNCAGSGTTAIACERLNRKWIGIEIEEKYCEIAAKRIEQERKQLKLF